MSGYISFYAAGDPAPQGSKSRTRTGGMYESSKRVKPWREIVAYTAMSVRRGITLHGDVEVDLTFYVRINADLDKLCRAVLDGLTDGRAWDDDKQVVSLRAEKIRGKHPTQGYGCDITVAGRS